MESTVAGTKTALAIYRLSWYAMTNDNADSESHGLSISRRMALALLGVGALGEVAAADGQATGQSNGGTTTSSSDSTPPGEVSHSIDEVLPGDKFGNVDIGPYSFTLQLSGTREPSWLVNPLNGPTDVNSSEYQQIAEVGYGVIPFSPGKVPVLRIVGHLNGKTDTETSVRVSIANREAYSPPGVDGLRVLEDDEVRQTLLEVTGVGETQVFDEVYLSDVEDVVTGLDNGHPLPSHTLLFEAKTEAPSADVTIGGATSVALELEAL